MTAGHEPRASHGPNETRDREGTDDERGGEPRRARDELDKTRHQNRSATQYYQLSSGRLQRVVQDKPGSLSKTSFTSFVKPPPCKTLSARRDCNHCSNARCIVHHLCVTPPCRWSQTRKCIRADKRTASDCALSQQLREKHATNRNDHGRGRLGRDARTKPQGGL